MLSIIRKLLIKTTVQNITCQLGWIWYAGKTNNTGAGEDAEQLELSDIVAENEKCHSLFGNSLAIFCEVHIHLAYYLEIPLLGIYPRQMECSPKDLCMSVYCTFTLEEPNSGNKSHVHQLDYGKQTVFLHTVEDCSNQRNTNDS